MRKVRVLFIHHHGTSGGASRSLTYLIQNFPPGSVEATVLTPPGTAVDLFKTVADKVVVTGELPEITSISGGRFYKLRLLKTLRNLTTLRRLKKQILEINPDIVHLNECTLVLVAKLCKRLGFKVVMHARVVLNDHERLLNRIIQNMIRRYVDHLIAIDGSVKNKLNNCIDNIDVVYNPLHRKISSSQVSSATTRTTCNVLFLSNLIAYKGIFDLMEALRLLRDDGHIKFYIAGSNSRPREFFESFKGRILDLLGIVQDIESRIRKIIADNNLQNVEYLGHIKNIDEWLEQTDILVFPSYLNGVPRSVFEAGALGIPSIISLRDKIEDVVQHQTTGLIVDEKRPAQLAEAISQLAHDEQLRARMGAAAKAHFSRLNDPQQSAAKVLSVYATVRPDLF